MNYTDANDSVPSFACVVLHTDLSGIINHVYFHETRTTVFAQTRCKIESGLNTTLQVIVINRNNFMTEGKI